jgi:hypothetical protein
MRSAVLVSIALMLMFNPASAFGCSCVPSPPGTKRARELAEWKSQGIAAIFEGSVEDAELKSRLIEASVGDLVPGNLEQGGPVMLVTFSVSRVYRGAQKPRMQVETGLGGGDCGFGFEIGKQYLVYAYKGESGRFSTGICTATALLEKSKANLAYLRGDPIVPEFAGSPSRGKVARLCVRVIQDVSDHAGDEDEDDSVLLFRVGQKSPIPSDEAEPDGKGLFCAGDVDPGKYRLLFRAMSGDAVTSYVYYPGVTKLSEASSADIRAGRDVSGLVLRIRPQPTFSVKGVLSTSNNSRLPTDAKVILVSVEQPFFALDYAAEVSPNGSFDFPKVLEGRYWTFVDVDSDGGSSGVPSWLTRKTELLVDRNVTDVSLVMIPKESDSR